MIPLIRGRQETRLFQRARGAPAHVPPASITLRLRDMFFSARPSNLSCRVCNAHVLTSITLTTGPRGSAGRDCGGGDHGRVSGGGGELGAPAAGRRDGDRAPHCRPLTLLSVTYTSYGLSCLCVGCMYTLSVALTLRLGYLLLCGKS